MITIPRNVCINDGILRWSPVPYADGYNIHSGNNYIDTVVGELNTEFEVPEHMDPPYSVSAWVKDMDGRDAHTHRSVDADSLFEPSGRLVTDENFQNIENWLTRFPYWDVTINNELQKYVEDAFYFDERGVTIQAYKTGPDQWTSGILTGPVERSYLYGYFEADICFDMDEGLWPAFWLLNTKYVSIRPEMDIMEMVGGKVHQSYHSWHPERNSRSSSREAPEGFNKYGVLWEPNRITWYVNRMPVFDTYGDHVSSQLMYPILNLAVGGDWPGKPAESLNYAEMTIKSFRVWQG